MSELERAFGVPVIEAYGMTEAAHQITSSPLPPRARKPGSVGVAAGTEVAVVRGVDRFLPPGESGEIVIRGANVVDRDRVSDQEWFDGGWLRTGDVGQLDAEGFLFITGRLKEVVNRGGSKVAPGEVEEVLLAHPAVAEAVAFGVPHPTLGEDLTAAVVLRDPAVAGAGEIVEFLRARLVSHKVPTRVLVVDRIPKGPTGKFQRLELARTLGQQLRADAATPRTDLERAVARIWTEILDLEAIGVHDEFIAIGGDSLSATRCLARVLGAFGVEVSLEAFMRAPTVAGLAALVTRQLADRNAEIERVLAEVEGLSDEAVCNLLTSDGARNA
jgi:hypothetical protein